MAVYDQLISRANVPVPLDVAKDVLKSSGDESVILKRAKRTPMSTKTKTQPVMGTLPEAYWVNGDTGLKQTTGASFDMPVMTAEELATIAIVPDAVFDDTSIDLWGELKPLLAEAIGLKVDAAGIFGLEKPESWPTALVPGAVAAGNTIEYNEADPGVAIAKLGQAMAENSGYDMNGFIAPAGTAWGFEAVRSANGSRVYDAANEMLYGRPMDEVSTGLWPVTTPATRLIGVDWRNVHVGIRQDITIKLLDQAVITDDEGKVIFNLAQQDAKALRVVFRVGFQIYTPANRAKGGTKFPAGVLRNAGI